MSESIYQLANQLLILLLQIPLAERQLSSPTNRGFSGTIAMAELNVVEPLKTEENRQNKRLDDQ